MVRLLQDLHGYDHLASMPLAIGLFISVPALVVLCAKHVRRAPQRHGAKTSTSGNSILAPKPSPKAQLVSSISNKVIPFIYKKKVGEESSGAEVEEGFGEGGLWQREILVGDKCRPPEFSGVIYYDSYGNQLSEMPPRTPRASSLPVGLLRSDG